MATIRTRHHELDYEQLLTPAEAAKAFAVTPQQLARWRKAGKIPTVKTLGGHHRFREADVRALLDATRQNRRASNV